MEDGVLACQGIEPVVIAERPLKFGLGGVAVALDDDVGFSRHPEVLREGLGDGQGFLTEDARKLLFRKVFRKGRNRRKDEFRRTPDTNGHRHPFAFRSVFCTVLVNLPVKTKFGFVVDLGPIHA